jgi:hypothetical protein
LLTWHYLSWFLFGFSLCEVLELVVIFTAIPSSSKMVFGWKTYCIFGVEGFMGSSFLDRSNFSSFGFTFRVWTMMFLSIKL